MHCGKRSDAKKSPFFNMAEGYLPRLRSDDYMPDVIAALDIYEEEMKHEQAEEQGLKWWLTVAFNFLIGLTICGFLVWSLVKALIHLFGGGQ